MDTLLSAVSVWLHEVLAVCTLLNSNACPSSSASYVTSCWVVNSERHDPSIKFPRRFSEVSGEAVLPRTLSSVEGHPSRSLAGLVSKSGPISVPRPPVT